MNPTFYEAFLQDMAAQGFGEIGQAKSLYVGELPQDAQVDAISLVSDASDPQTPYIPRRDSRVSMWVRSRSTAKAFKVADDLIEAYHGKQNITFGNYHVFSIMALSHIDDMETDGQGNKLTRVVFKLQWYKSVV